MRPAMTDTTPDYAELIEKLEKVEPDTPGEGVTRYYRNPDGPGAAAAFRALLERYEALERERTNLIETKREQIDRLNTRIAELETSVETLRRHALEWEDRAKAAEARVTELEDLCNSLEAQAMGLAYDLKRAEDKLAEAMKVIGQIDNALNDQFAAGIEEREGGSARRQERLMKSGEELRRAARKFLKENGNGE